MAISSADSLSKAMHFIVGEYFHKLSFEDSPNSITNIWGLQKQTKVDT